MPAARKRKTASSRATSAKRRRTGSRKTSAKRSSTNRLTRTKNPRRALNGSARTLASTNPDKLPTSKLTFVFECTQQGCGYRIYREEKAEPGQLRFDIKCPKCHNEEFRCMGIGDYPETFTSPLAESSEIDFSQTGAVGVDSD